jgi:hypothetical protein
VGYPLKVPNGGYGGDRPMAISRETLEQSKPRLLLRAAQWMLAQEGRVDDDLWAQVHRILHTATSSRTRLMAARLFAERIDPAPRAPVIINAPTQINVRWTSQSPPSTSSSPTSPAPSSNGYTIRFAGGTASSPTDDSENP